LEIIHFGKIIFFRKIFLNSKHFILEYFFNTIKLFIKPFPTPQNGFGKLLINWQINTQFISPSPKPFHSLEIGIKNSFIISVAAFQNGFGQSERPKSIESRK
jgi:hypothetical protein